MLITLSRQYASGSSVVAERIAQALGWRLVDNDLVDEVARRAQLPREEVERHEERPASFLERLARVASLELPELVVPQPGLVDQPDEARLVRITGRVVTEAAAGGRVVLVGRAAAAVLALEHDALHVHLVASRAFRAARAAERLGVSADEAAARTDEVDRARARYHRMYYAREWNDPAGYDMVLHTERLGFEGAADLILARASALGWSGSARRP